MNSFQRNSQGSRFGAPYCVAVLACVVIATNSSAAQDKATDGENLLNAMKATRGELFSGIAILELKKFEGKDVISEVRKLYFDNAAGCIRCDRTVVSTTSPSRSFTCTIVQSPEEVLFFSADTKTIARYPAGTRLNSIKANTGFDPVAVGMGGAAVYNGIRFDTVVNAFLQKTIRSLSMNSGLATIEFDGQGPNDEFLFRLTIDVNKRYAPVAYTELHVSHNGVAVGRTLSEASTSWVIVNDTYVPSSWNMSLNGKRYADVSFAWSSVNEVLPEDLFSVSGMQLPKDTSILNYKSGPKAIIEGKTN